ncbi:MAG TPA: hypothetical protein VGR08_02920 [Thermomicrobiales bacterium]|nr:hypothetical protein [Thermomicrobiales bacterium]
MVGQIEADDVVSVQVVDSFNNLRALNNILNNNDVDVTVGDVSILNSFLDDNNITLEDFLNDNNVLLSDVVAIGILDGGDIIIFV